MIFSGKKKGQASTEFLMTYGWVLLTIGIVIAALVLTFSWRPQDSIADSCTFLDSFSCIDAKLNESGIVNVSLKNTDGSTINITKFSCRQDNETFETTPNILVSSGETFLVSCDLQKPYLLGEKIRLPVSVQFLRTGRSFPVTSEGNIIASVS